MKELSIRYMELFRTSLDTIHTYGTHVNMSISVQRSAETVLKPRSARRPRSSHRPIHWKPRICMCRSRHSRNAQRSNEANPIPQSHKRHRGRWPPKLRCCQRAARTSKSPIPCTKRELSRYSRPRPAAHRWWSSCQSIDDAAAHHQPLAATVELLAPTKAATEGEIRKS